MLAAEERDNDREKRDEEKSRRGLEDFKMGQAKEDQDLQGADVSYDYDAENDSSDYTDSMDFD